MPKLSPVCGILKYSAEDQVRSSDLCLSYKTRAGDRSQVFTLKKKISPYSTETLPEKQGQFILRGKHDPETKTK